MKKIQKALVTGGAGFIGSHLVDALLAQGGQVTVIDDLSSGHRSNLAHVADRISFVEASICDFQMLYEAVKGAEVVFHLAAVVAVQTTVEQPLDSALINDHGTLQLLEAARQAGVRRVVMASSSAVYGDDPVVPKREDMRPAPLTPYAVQKLTNELNARVYARLYGLETVAMRFFNVFGPRQDPSSPYSGVISIFLNRALADRAPVIFGDGQQSRDFIYVADVVNACLLATGGPDASGGAFNVGCGRFVTIDQLWQTVAAMNGVQKTAEYQPARPGDICASYADISRARELLGFQPAFSFEQGLQATLDWYRQAAATK